MALDKKKLAAVFVVEVREHIHHISDRLAAFVKRPDDMAILDDIFRGAHSIKGTARMMSLQPMTQIAHHLEDVFDALREKRIENSEVLTAIVFKGIDAVSGMIDQFESGGEITGSIDAICGELVKAAGGALPDDKASDDKAKSCRPDGNDAPQSVTRNLRPATSAPQPGGSGLPIDSTIRIETDKLDKTITLIGEMLSGKGRPKQRAAAIDEMEKLLRLNMDMVTRAVMKSNAGEGWNGEKLLDLSQLLCHKIKQIVADSKRDAEIQSTRVHDLQRMTLAARIVPISTMFDKFHRVVRATSQTIKKEIRLVVEGGDTELDKNIIDRLGDPVMQMVTNAMEHGVEDPDERLRAGKDICGVIRLSARHEYGNVRIDISDDGAGISLHGIKQAALRKGLCGAEELERMDKSQLVDMIFRPGFSTNVSVTDVSGRGVGMDVVKETLVEDLKGSIAIETDESVGTCFRIRVPLTHSLIRAVRFTLCGLPFAIPSIYIAEVCRLSSHDIIDSVDSKTILLREQIVPVAELEDLLSVQGDNKLSVEGETIVLITDTGDGMFGLVVESLTGQDYVAMKPLPSHMKGNRFVIGMSIPADSSIVTVLNMPSIIEYAHKR